MVGIWMWALACKKTPVEPAPAPEPVAAAPAPEPEPVEPIEVELPALPDGLTEDELQAVHRALSVRDPEPACADVEALTSMPLETLLYVIEHLQMPPAAPMRAANCVIEGHAEAAEEQIVGWMGDPDTLGLTKLVLAHLDTMPLNVAVSAVKGSIAGPHWTWVEPAAKQSTRPEIAAIQPTPPAHSIVVRVPPAGHDEMQRALSARDGAPDCATVEAMATDGAPLDALQYFVAHVSMPPTVPMRAATCIVDRHAEAATADLIGWTTDPDTLGLAKLVLQRIDTLPLAVALSVVEAGLDGPHAAVVQEALDGSQRAELKELAATP